jgi:hypothetical protein
MKRDIAKELREITIAGNSSGFLKRYNINILEFLQLVLSSKEVPTNITLRQVEDKLTDLDQYQLDETKPPGGKCKVILKHLHNMFDIENREAAQKLLEDYLKWQVSNQNRLEPSGSRLCFTTPKTDEQLAQETLDAEIKEDLDGNVDLAAGTGLDLTPSSSTESTESTTSTETPEPTSVQPTPQQPVIEEDNMTAKEHLDLNDVNVLDELGIVDINDATPENVRNKFIEITNGMKFEELKTQGGLTEKQRKLVDIYKTGIMNNTDEGKIKLARYLDEVKSERSTTPVTTVTPPVTTITSEPVTTVIPPPTPVQPPEAPLPITPEPVTTVPELVTTVPEPVQLPEVAPPPVPTRTEQLEAELKREIAKAGIEQPPEQPVDATLPGPVQPTKFTVENPMSVEAAKTQRKEDQLIAEINKKKVALNRAGIYTSKDQKDIMKGEILALVGQLRNLYPAGRNRTRINARINSLELDKFLGGSRKKTLRPRRGNTQNERRTRRSKNRANRTHKNSRRRT